MGDRGEFRGDDRARDRDRSRSRDRDREAEEEPRKRRSRFSDAPVTGFSDAPPTGFSDAPPQAAQLGGGAVPQDARERAMALAASLSQKFAAGAGAAAAAPSGFSGGLGLSPLFGAPGVQQRGPPPGEPPPPPGKMMGTAKRWNMEKGFGFVVPDDGGEDIFVHAESILDGNALYEGGRVCFRKGFDSAKNKVRAEDVTGAYTDPSRPMGKNATGAAPPGYPYGGGYGTGGYAPPQYGYGQPPGYGYDASAYGYPGQYAQPPPPGYGYGAAPPGGAGHTCVQQAQLLQ